MAGRVQHERTQSTDQAAFFSHFNELNGWHDAPGGVTPAHQRFHPHALVNADIESRAALQANDGLVHHKQLVVHQSPTQVGLNARPAGSALAHRRLKHHVFRTARALGFHHGDVGVLNDGVGITQGLVGDHHAHADAAMDLLAMDRIRLVGDVDQTLRNGVRVIEVLQVMQQHNELIPIQTGGKVFQGKVKCNRVVVPERSAQAAGDLAQHLVTSGMA